MKNFLFIVLSTALISCSAPTAPSTTKKQEDSDKKFDPDLAAEVGADEYGMRKFYFAYLKRGPNRSKDSVTRANLQAAHMANINKMVDAGKLVLAGPFMDDGEVRGIYVFAVESMEEAEALTASDPAVQAGSLVMELHPWYGTAAIMKLTELHYQVAKIII